MKVTHPCAGVKGVKGVECSSLTPVQARRITPGVAEPDVKAGLPGSKSLGPSHACQGEGEVNEVHHSTKEGLSQG